MKQKERLVTNKYYDQKLSKLESAVLDDDTDRIKKSRLYVRIKLNELSKQVVEIIF